MYKTKVSLFPWNSLIFLYYNIDSSKNFFYVYNSVTVINSTSKRTNSSEIDVQNLATIPLKN